MKNYSKAAKLKAHKANLANLGLAETPKREANGRTSRAGIERNPDAPNLKARARQMGKPECKYRDMADEMLSEGAGMALAIICEPVAAKRLWGHYTTLTAAEARYHRSLGRSINPKTAKLEMMQERFETRSDDKPDLRTEEERDRAAVTGWMRWQGMLGRIDAHHREAIYRAYRHHAELVDAGKVLPAGRRFVAAMLVLDGYI